ncbi:MAG: DEAD/DEAH box helicase [Chitinophagales bacterium]
MTFSDFNFHPDLQSGLEAMGYQTPTPIQQQAIPKILSGSDLIACAQTGTGKTAAYLLPILHKIKSAESNSINTLIIAPTRELALQIDQQIEALGYFISVSSIAVYGGGDGIAWEQQKKALKMGADIVIATPGRLISMLTQHDLELDGLKHLILDEADRMLDMGFHDDIMRIISYLPKDRQTLLFSATMPPKIRTLASKILKDPEQINIAISKPAEGILQQAYLVYNPNKLSLLKSLLAETSYKSIIVFCSTKENVKKLYNELKRTKITVKSFHSDLDQKEREAIMMDFKNRKLQMIVGTDILSRGIDVEGIDLVVNYDVPPDAEDYIHRIGRTARAETTGTAITFINDIDQFRFHRIEELMEREVPKIAMPAGLPSGPAYDPKRRVQRPMSNRHGNNRPQGKKRPHDHRKNPGK